MNCSWLADKKGTASTAKDDRRGTLNEPEDWDCLSVSLQELDPSKIRRV